MRTKKNFVFIVILISLIACGDVRVQDQASKVTKIAFGSCAWQEHELPIFNTIVKHDPDMFIFLGDNIYADTKNMDTLRSKYQRLGSKPSFQNLKKNVPILATWDDHDYGWNGSGKDYLFKEKSKEIFLDFFEELDSSSRRKHPGIYHSYTYEIGKNKLQIILLDIRTFRDGLKLYNGEFDQDSRYFYEMLFAPHDANADSTMLGSQQWKWLEEQLTKPADVRIIASGTQFGVEYNGWETWSNFPHEQQRMLDLIRKTKANGVIFITGDVHYSEISRLETDFYPIYDFTASGLSATWLYAGPNKNRIEGPVMENHFGLISIDWDEESPRIKMENWDISNNQRIEFSINLQDVSFKN